MIKRIHSIDTVRGIVMIIMALDHTRDFLHISSLTQQPTDLTHTTTILFFTRWITHLCAPTFVFLSGTSAYISFKNADNLVASKKHLLFRGIWLILLDLTLVNFGLWFDISFNIFLIDVLSAIGFGFIVLSFLLKSSIRSIAITGVIIIALHDLAPLVPFAETSLVKRILMPFFTPGAFAISHATTIVIGYPPLPWLGILLCGFASGMIFQLPEYHRKKIFLQLVIGGWLLFVILRLGNLYGDPVHWSEQKSGLFSFLSFINVTKYPPSLQFCLLTLGLMFLIFYFVEGKISRFTKISGVYGKVPLFYFVIHWYILHPILFLMVYLQGYKTSDLIFGFNFGRPKGLSGVDLWAVYLVWIGVVVFLYPLCKIYGFYKESHKEKLWLRYL